MNLLISTNELDSKSSRELIPLSCLACNKTHYRTKNVILRTLNGNHQHTLRNCFCSVNCRGKYSQTSKQYTCQNCHITFSRIPRKKSNPQFCSLSCAATFNNEHKIKTIKCLNCQRDFKPYKNGWKQKFCKLQCSKSYKTNKIINSIKNNTHNIKSDQTIRKYLLIIYDNKCNLCGWNKINQTSNKPTIQVDHVDGNPLNNQFHNLRLLCPNCHSLTPTFMALNKGNGRKFRK
jgi:hypothetical protein